MYLHEYADNIHSGATPYPVAIAMDLQVSPFSWLY